MDFSRVEFDLAKGRIHFHGDCLEMHPFCQAACCRTNWIVEITPEEYATGFYEAEARCRLSMNKCHALDDSCLSRFFLLKKKPDKSCIHLSGNLCSIHSQRPAVCRDFVCTGFEVRAANAAGSDPRVQPALHKDDFISRLNEEAIYLQHPLLKLHGIIYQKARKTIIFIKEMVGACGKFFTQEEFDYPQFEEQDVGRLIDLFAMKVPLRDIYARFIGTTENGLSKNEFAGIIWVLNKHNLILDVRNFPALLNGIGGV